MYSLIQFCDIFKSHAYFVGKYNVYLALWRIICHLLVNNKDILLSFSDTTYKNSILTYTTKLVIWNAPQILFVW